MSRAAARGRVHALFEVQRWPEAAIAAEEALQDFPFDTELLRMRALTLYGLGRHDEALEVVERSLTTQWDNVGTHILKGSVLAALGRYGKAHSSLDHALAIEPESVPALVSYVEALVAELATHPVPERAAELVQLASSYAELAVALDPEDIGARRSLVKTDLIRGDLGAAQTAAKDLLAVDPSAAHNLELAGVVSEQSGDVASASDFYVAAVRTKPTSSAMGRLGALEHKHRKQRSRWMSKLVVASLLIGAAVALVTGFALGGAVALLGCAIAIMLSLLFEHTDWFDAYLGDAMSREARTVVHRRRALD